MQYFETLSTCENDIRELTVFEPLKLLLKQTRCSSGHDTHCWSTWWRTRWRRRLVVSVVLELVACDCILCTPEQLSPSFWTRVCGCLVEVSKRASRGTPITHTTLHSLQCTHAHLCFWRHGVGVLRAMRQEKGTSVVEFTGSAAHPHHPIHRSECADSACAHVTGC
jgi:hypothetical protein